MSKPTRHCLAAGILALSCFFSSPLAANTLIECGEADVNCDVVVGGADYTVWADNYGRHGASFKGDLNQDGVVDSDDFAILSNTWGTSGHLLPRPVVRNRLAWTNQLAPWLRSRLP